MPDSTLVPQYKREAYESPAKLPVGPTPGNGVASDPASVGAPPLIKSIEEPRRDDVSTLVNAANILHRTLMERIAFHDGEARKLREVLAKFSGSSQPAANVPQFGGSDMEELLRIARTLEPGK